ncbi:hypothetical protein VE03_07128 [Pseudogymnoascus sp. 23342-1-I1]|nr:hypothetical protein VE03_07128 [Pseudogymnoascus sp. 23342-1-I1]
MDHGSIEWKDGLLEVVLAMNTQIHSTIRCAPAKLLFRERSSYVDWLNSQARKDLSIGIKQEDPTMGPIFERELQPELEDLLDPQLRQAPGPGTELYSSAGTRARAGARAQFRRAPELNFEPSSGSELGLEIVIEPELNYELSRRAPTRALLQAEREFILELESPRIKAQAQLQLRLEPELGIELSNSGLNFEPSSGSEPEPERELELEPERELNSEPRRGTRARVSAQPRTELRATPDPIIERAIAATQRARISIVRKYPKKHDIQHFDIGAIVSIKVPREDRTSTDNKRLFTQILEEPYPHRYQILTASSII